MKDSIVLINPNLVLQSNDIFTTGIVYMPIGLASFAGALKEAGRPLQVIDAFGERPNQWWRQDGLIFRGLTHEDVASKIDPSTKAVVLYAINVTYHRAVIGILQKIKQTYPALPVIIMENTQAVTAYSLRRVQEDFYRAGADYLLTGEAEARGLELIRAILPERNVESLLRIDGIGFQNQGQVHYSTPHEKIENLDGLPDPPWDLFPLTNYWSLHYSHGPLSSTRYLPLLTSRGCPYPCRFCVIPETNDKRWRAMSARRVVEQMETLVTRYDVREFHLEDVDPTIDDQRIQDICRELIARRLDIIWKICSGTKVETIRGSETITLMAKAGCRYVSISPESGSAKVLKLINKPFNIDHAKMVIAQMRKVGIRTQACFILGFPGEEGADRGLSMALLLKLARLGLDEVAIFIVTPVPGSAIFPELQGFESYSELTFSPTWRRDYQALNRFRLRMYAAFLLTKLIYHPITTVIHFFRFLSRRFQTKMEMTAYRAIQTTLLKAGIMGTRVEALP